MVMDVLTSLSLLRKESTINTKRDPEVCMFFGETAKNLTQVSK